MAQSTVRFHGSARRMLTAITLVGALGAGLLAGCAAKEDKADKAAAGPATTPDGKGGTAVVGKEPATGPGAAAPGEGTPAGHAPRGTASATGTPEPVPPKTLRFVPWFLNDEYNFALVLQPQVVLKSELMNLLPGDAQEHLAGLKMQAGGAPVDQLVNLEMLAVLLKLPENPGILFFGPEPKDLHLALYVRFKSPVTFDEFREAMDLPDVEESKVDGRTIYVIGDNDGAVIPLDERTYVAASPSAQAAVLAAKPNEGAMRGLLSLHAESSAVIAAVNLEGQKEKVAEMLEPFAAELPPEIAALPKQIQGLSLSMGTTPDSFLRVAVAGYTPSDAQALETMANVHLQQAKQMWAAAKQEFADSMAAEEQALLGVADKMVESLAVHRAGSTLTLDVSLGTSWEELASALKPAIDKARRAAEIVRQQNDLRQIGLALHNYHDAIGQFPPSREQPAWFDEEGGPKLTWRVHILPYLEESELYNMIELKESADSEQNKPLLAATPKPFVGRLGDSAGGKTPFVRLSGPDTMYPMKKLGFAGVLDGLANTIMVVNLPAGKEISWLKTTDLPFDPDKPLEGIWPIPEEGLQVLLGDGSTRIVSPDVDPGVFKALITPAGFETIDPEAAFMR